MTAGKSFGGDAGTGAGSVVTIVRADKRWKERAQHHAREVTIPHEREGVSSTTSPMHRRALGCFGSWGMRQAGDNERCVCCGPNRSDGMGCPANLRNARQTPSEMRDEILAHFLSSF